jgi:hypothetical protein
MAERIKQVAITYLTHRTIWWWGIALATLGIAPNLFQLNSRSAIQHNPWPLVFIIAIPLFVAFPFLVGHAKAQFAHERARLIPNFAPAHLATLAVVLLSALWIFPLVLAWSGRIDPLALVAIAVAIGVPIIWGAHLNRASLILISLAAFYSIFTTIGSHWWFPPQPALELPPVAEAAASVSGSPLGTPDSALETDAPHHVAQSMIIFVGLLLLAVWLRRLQNLDEEADDYQSTIQWRVTRPGSGEASAGRRITAAQINRSPLIVWVNDAWFARLSSAPSPGGVPQLARLLRYGFGYCPTEIAAISMTIMVAAGTLFMAYYTFSGNTSRATTLNFFLFFATIMPGWMGGESLAQRRSRLAGELFRPATRPQFIDALFTAVARNSILYWLIMNFGFLLMARHLLGDSLTLKTAVMYAFLSAATAFMTLGLSLRIAVWRSQFLRLTTAMSLWLLLAPLAGWWLTRDKFGEWPFVLLAVVMAAAGAALLGYARKVWLNLELG